MDRNGGRTRGPRARRRRLWVLAAGVGLAVSQPAVAGSQPVQTGVAAQLSPFQGALCGILHSVGASLAQFPAAAAVLASIAEAFGCTGGTPPGTTTTTVFGGSTTSTTVSQGTTTTVPGSSTTTSTTTAGGPTSSSVTITPTTLGPCAPTTTLGTIVPTTIPCIPTG